MLTVRCCFIWVYFSQATFLFFPGPITQLPLRTKQNKTACIQNGIYHKNLPIGWPRQNGRLFADIFKCIFLNEDICISISISLKYVPKSLIKDIEALVQIMAWRQSGDNYYLNQWWFVDWRTYKYTHTYIYIILIHTHIYMYTPLGLNDSKVQYMSRHFN